jgi:nitrate/nitrite transporter NarK
MIQRIQSVYLLLVTALMAALAIITKEVLLHSVVFAVLGVISLITIFLYKNRKRQIGIAAILLLLLIIAFIYVNYINWQVFHFRPDIETAVIGAVIGIISLVSAILAFLAIRSIKKDEKLVRSLDRLR